MTALELQKQLNSGRIHKPKVDYLVSEILAQPHLMEPLLQNVFEQDLSGDLNASWVFDHVLRKEADLILLVIDDFIAGLEKIQSESSLRPMAHVCQLIAENYFKRKQNHFLQGITDTHLEKMVTVCFDWLIADHKIATKVFAMTCLFYLGERWEWVRPELRVYLEQNLASGSPGLQNRGIKILDQLKNLGY